MVSIKEISSDFQLIQRAVSVHVQPVQSSGYSKLLNEMYNTIQLVWFHFNTQYELTILPPPHPP